jgi:hypothetical protein
MLQDLKLLASTWHHNWKIPDHESFYSHTKLFEILNKAAFGLCG